MGCATPAWGSITALSRAYHAAYHRYGLQWGTIYTEVFLLCLTWSLPAS